jgi:metal-responsive CopG/Arc/MetJ family transcriptional regulator
MTKRVAISVPDDLLAAVDAERKAAHVSRSRLFGMAAASYVEERRKARAIDRYVRSYTEYPETDEELESIDAFLRAAWAADERCIVNCDNLVTVMAEVKSAVLFALGYD